MLLKYNLFKMKNDTKTIAESKESNTIPSELPSFALGKLEVIQSWLEPGDRVTYGQRLKQEFNFLLWD